MVRPITRSRSQSGAAEAATINPAYVAGGIAAAGLGAAAIEQHKDTRKHTPSLIENVGTGVVTAMDGVAGAAGATISAVMMPLMPLMVGGMVLNMFAHPLAQSVDGITGAKLSNVTGTGINYLNGAQTFTFAQAGKKISPTLGKNITRGVQNVAGFAAPVLDTVSKLPGLSGLHSEHIKKIPGELGNASIMHSAGRAAWIGGASLGMYAVARSFGSQLYALRQLQADLTGKDISEVSSYSVLMNSNLPKPVLDARDKLLKLSGIHALASTAGLVMALKSHLIDGKLAKMLGPVGEGAAGAMLGMMAYQIPDQIAEIAEGFVGSPILAHYNGLRDVQASGQALPPEAIAEFVYACNDKLRAKGHTGQHFAMALSDEYVAEGTKIATILEEVSNGKMQARINAITEKNKQEKTEEAPEDKVPSHVERLQAPLKTMVRPEVGSFTNKLNQQAALAATAPPSQAI